jgi:pimeloyl-ACP methyl ester carboxylesterase
MSVAELNGTQIRYLDEGEGPALLLLHSAVCDLTMWDEVADGLARDHRVLRLDLRGFGDSTMPPGAFSWVDDVRGLLDEIGVERAVVVGSSFGGRIALDFTLAEPGRVAGLVLVCAGVRGRPPSPEMEAYNAEENRLAEAGELDAVVDLNVRTWLIGPGRKDDDVSHALWERVAGMQRRNVERQLADEAAGAEGPENAPGPPAAERLTEVDAPTLVVIGTGDQPGMVETAGVLAAEIPHAQLVEFEGAAHFPSLEEPERFTELLRDFVRARVGTL